MDYYNPLSPNGALSEFEFAERVVGLAGVREALTVEEFNEAILDLCGRVLARRAREKRARLLTAQEEMARRRNKWIAVQETHSRGEHCGQVFCDRDGKRDVE